MEMGAEAVVIKQEIKEEDEVCFELISVKEERVLEDETEQVESGHLDTIDCQSCFVADGIKEENDIEQEYSNDTELNENVEFEEQEMNCDWFEPPLNEPDPLAIAEIEGTGGAVNFEAGESSNSSNRIGSPRPTESNCGDKKYKSGYSSSITRNETHGLKHQPITHIEEKPFKCNECDYSCNQLSTLKYHKMTHTGEQAFNCSECNYSCNQLSSLKDHMIAKYHMVANTEVKPFKCNKCDYTCSKLSGMKTHRLTHIKEKLFKWNNCDYTSNRLWNLQSHRWTHIKDKHKCTMCDYSSNRLSNLKTHMLTHTKEKPFKCNECVYSCNRLSNLKYHMTTLHTKTKSFKCTDCTYSCNRLSRIKVHIKRHT